MSDLSRDCRESQLKDQLHLKSRSLSDLSREMGDDGKTDKDEVGVGSNAKKTRRCHQCHTPLDEQVHVGVKSGVGVCSLPHWHLCD